MSTRSVYKKSGTKNLKSNSTWIRTNISICRVASHFQNNRLFPHFSFTRLNSSLWNHFFRQISALLSEGCRLIVYLNANANRIAVLSAGDYLILGNMTGSLYNIQLLSDTSFIVHNIWGRRCFNNNFLLHLCTHRDNQEKSEICFTSTLISNLIKIRSRCFSFRGYMSVQQALLIHNAYNVSY